MKTIFILYLYISILMGYIITSFFSRKIIYIASILALWSIMCMLDKVFEYFKCPILSTEKRVHVEGREPGGDIARTVAVILVPTIQDIRINEQFMNIVLLCSLILRFNSTFETVSNFV